MARPTGTPQIVLQGISDSISLQAIDRDSYEPITITAVDSVAIYSPSGTAITHGGTTSYSGSVATLTFTVSSAKFSVANGNKAVWTLNSSAYKQTTFFDVALRDFQSQLTDTDITNIHKGITLPSGVTSWASWRLRAWRRIERLVRKAMRASPNLIFYPERFFDAHLALTLAEFFRPDSYARPDSEEWAKYRSYLREGLELVREELADIDYDADGDGLLGSGDTGHDRRTWFARETDL